MSTAENDHLWKVMKWSILAAIAAGLLLEGYLIYTLKQESTFSALYLVPGSYSNYLEDGTVSFTYGVECYERRATTYRLDIYLGERKIAERKFTLCNPEKKKEEKVEITGLRNLAYPVKLRLVLSTADSTNDVHFWIKGAKESNSSG